MLLNIRNGSVIDIVQMNNTEGDSNATYRSFRGIYHHAKANLTLVYTSFIRNNKLIFTKINMTSRLMESIQINEDHEEAGLLEVWDSELRGVATRNNISRIYTIMIDDTGLFHPISELRN